MGMQYLPLAALEDLKAFIDGSEKAFKANFTNYEAWEKELGATGGYLTNIPENKSVKGMQTYVASVNVVKCIETITKLFTECTSKKKPIDLTESGATKDLESIYIKAAPSILDMSQVSYPLATLKRGYIALKQYGWNGSKATQYAKLLQTALRNVGKYAKFQSTLVGLARSANSATGDERRELNKCVKQAVHLAKARHALIVIGIKQYTALKKTI